MVGGTETGMTEFRGLKEEEKEMHNYIIASDFWLLILLSFCLIIKALHEAMSWFPLHQIAFVVSTFFYLHPREVGIKGGRGKGIFRQKPTQTDPSLNHWNDGNRGQTRREENTNKPPQFSIDLRRMNFDSVYWNKLLLSSPSKVFLYVVVPLFS